MSKKIDTTIVVQVTCKVNVSGEFDSAQQLKLAAVLKASNEITNAIGNTETEFSTPGNIVDLGISVEGAQALVNDEVLERWFQS